MANKQFDFTALPYDIRRMIYDYLSRKDYVRLFRVCKKFLPVIVADTGQYRKWTTYAKSIDLEYHCRAFTSSRMRNVTQKLELGFNFLRSENVAEVISKFSYAICKMSRLQSIYLDFSQCENKKHESCVYDNEGYSRTRTTCSFYANGDKLNIKLIDLMFPNEHVQVLALRVKKAADLKPHLFNYKELIDRYPSLKSLAVRFSERDIDADPYIEMLLTSQSLALPLDHVMIAHGASDFKVYNLQNVKAFKRVDGQDRAMATVSKFEHFGKLIK